MNNIINYCSCYSDSYLFYVIKTKETTDFYYVGLGVPILNAIHEGNTELFLTYRQTVNKDGVFRNFQTDESGVIYEIIDIHYAEKSSKRNNYMISSNENFNEVFMEFLKNNVTSESDTLNKLARIYYPEEFI